MKRLLPILLLAIACAAIPAHATTKIYMHQNSSLDSNCNRLASAHQLGRGSGGSTNIITSVTTATASGTNIQLTNTAGANALLWCSQPLSAGVTISGTITCNLWAKESATSVNASLQCFVYLDHAGSLTQICDAQAATELTASIANKSATCTPTSTAFVSGDRIAIKPALENCATSGCPTGTMASGSVTMDYDSGASAADGDAWLQTTETLSFASGVGSADPEIAQITVGAFGTNTLATNLSYAGATTAGSTLGAGVTGQGNTNSLASITDSSNAWTIVTAAHASVNLATPCSSTVAYTDIAYVGNSVSTTTITLTQSATNSSWDAEAWIIEIWNMPTSAPYIDVTGTLSNQSTAGSTVTGAQVTTTGVADMIFSATYNTDIGNSVAYPWGWATPISQGNPGGYLAAAAGTYQPSYAESASNACWCSSTVAFGAPASGGGSTPVFNKRKKLEKLEQISTNPKGE